MGSCMPFRYGRVGGGGGEKRSGKGHDQSSLSKQAGMLWFFLFYFLYIFNPLKQSKKY